MSESDRSPVTTTDDPRLAEIGREDVAGEDQIAERLAATPDERLDSLTAMLDFIEDARAALRRA